jgi:23S rRNA pseudouridine2605 synthase
MGEPVRLQRYLAQCGVAARRKAEEMITAGRVTVNGEVVRVLGTKIDPDDDAVMVDGEAVVENELFYVIFNKPKACITAVSDDRGRPTVMDYLPNLPVPVKPVGRLDFYSEGVLLLTNDGELASKLLAPASHVAKTYHVKVHGQVTKEDLATLRGGVMLDDGSTTMPADVTILPGESKHTWLGITIHEGKHRQIHRMLEARGYAVDKLQRVAFANLTFHNLRIGDARELTQVELNELRSLAGLDHSTVARGVWRVDRETTDIPRRAKTKARLEAEDAANAPPDYDSDGDEPFEDEDGDDDGAEVGADKLDDGRGPGPAPAPRSRAAAGTREPTSGGRETRAASPRGAAGAPRGASSSPRGAAGAPRGARSSGNFGGPRAASSPRVSRDGGGDRGPRGASSSRGGFGGPRDGGGGPRGASSSRGGFGGPRDGGGGPRGASSSRGGFGGPRDGGDRGPRGGGSFGRGPRDAGGEARGGYGGSRDARGGAGPRSAPRDGAPRGGSRDGAPRDSAPRGVARDGASRGPSRGGASDRGAYGGARDARAGGGRAPGGPTGQNYGTTRPAKGTTDRGRSFNAGAGAERPSTSRSAPPRGPRAGGPARSGAPPRSSRSGAPPRGRSTGPKRGR